MPDIPDISSMSPDRWLSKMQQVREELLEEFDRAMSEAADASEAVSLFEEIFEEYSVNSETGKSKRLLEVRAEQERVIFGHESGEATFEIEYEDGGWRASDSEEEDESESEEPSARRRALAVRALQLIPWWTEGAFTRRVGRPRDFVD